MKTNDMTMGQAMTLLFGSLKRQGPGDDDFTKTLLCDLKLTGKRLRVADLGCGTGAGSVVLAQLFGCPVLSVDTSAAFLTKLDQKANALGLNIKTLCADMGGLDPTKYQFDLLWSEGAAYNLTFEGAMEKWGPLICQGGVAVVSELSWFGTERPMAAVNFWKDAYPQMASEADNKASALRHSFEVLFTRRLPAAAWWQNYYDPLLSKAAELAKGAPPMLADAITDLLKETQVFRECAEDFGYTFYVLKAR